MVFLHGVLLLEIVEGKKLPNVDGIMGLKVGRNVSVSCGRRPCAFLEWEVETEKFCLAVACRFWGGLSIEMAHAALQKCWFESYRGGDKSSVLFSIISSVPDHFPLIFFVWRLCHQIKFLGSVCDGGHCGHGL